MKRLFTLLFLTIFMGSGAIAQEESKIDYDRDTKWFFGVNTGGTWTTQHETDWRLQAGYGFTLGRSILGQRKGSPFSFDLRGRFLNAYVSGISDQAFVLDSVSSGELTADGYSNVINTYRDSIGYFIPNYRTRLWEWDLELVLNLNSLREKTGFNVYFWGGIGGTAYTVKTDLLNDPNGSDTYTLYDYPTIGTNKKDLKNASDDGYETKLVGGIPNDELNIDWMPSIGAGISYQVTPWFSIGAEHKMTWTRTNMWDGMNYTSPGVLSTKNDIYHYSGVGMKFNILAKATPPPLDDLVKDEDTLVVDPIVDNTPRQKPIVDIYDPSSSPYTTKSEYFKLQANVYYVDGRNDITFKQNGSINNNFYYDANTDKFYSNVVLQPGQNLFEITGVNDAGQDYESTIIIYEIEEKTANPPIVTITNPPYSPYTTQNSIFGLAATVLEVDSKAQIRVYLNGAILNNFSYNLTSKILNSTLNLMEGTNTVTVTATNAVGSDSKTVQIIYDPPVVLPPPVVTFIDPSVDPYTTTVKTKPIRATVLNVNSKSDIHVKVNGFNTSAFSYNSITKEVNFVVNLNVGANVVEIKGTNTVGSDIESTTIIYERPETPKPPIVTYIDPGVDPITVWTSTYNVEAKVQNVTSASNIQLTINGVSSTAFSFSPSSELMNFTTSLVEGANVVSIKGTNKWGSDIEATTIIYKKMITLAPPIVNITYPSSDNQVFTTPNINLVANVLNVDNAANIQVLVNGSATTAFTFNTATKVLVLPLSMNEGANTVNITGTNTAGSDSDARIVIYEIPQQPQPPTVTITNPPTTPYFVEEADYYFTATTTNIDSKAQIALMFNGAVVPASQYSFTATSQIIYDADLIPGNNVLNVTVTNADGSASDMAIVNYKEEDEPCIIPTIGYISPVPFSTVTEAAQTIDAQINNWTSGTTVELQLNGASVGYMTYNSGTSLASKAVTLNEGSNSLKVIVTNDCGTNQSYFTLNYEKEDDPCDEPTVTAITSVSYTTLDETATIEAVIANVESATFISVVHNGAAIDKTYDAGSGNMSATVNLTVGTNTVIVQAKTPCGAATIAYTIVREECKVPVISSVSPADSYSTEETSITVSATVTESVASEIIVLVNGISQPFTYNETTDALTAAVSLNEGTNEIVITATNACGSDEEKIRVSRTIPCDDIVTNYLTPTSGTATSTESSYSITLNASGIENASQINCTFNGTTQAFAFDDVTGNITISGLTLNDGANTVAVSMNNGCSTANVNYTINYEGCKTPVITINGIYDGATLSASAGMFTAMLENVNSAGEITLTLNGAPLDFTFEEASGLLQATFLLNDGSNVFVITINACETVSQTVNVTFVEPCEEINYTMVAPVSTDQTVVEPAYSISLTATGIETSSQIGVKHNGSTIPFTFDASTNLISISGITLTDGANAIVVDLKNDCSSASITYNITYDGCKPPVITLGANPATVSEAVYTYAATITNIASSSELVFLVNGAPSPFVFDPSSGSFTAEVELEEGVTNFSLTANGCESKSSTSNVTYTIPCEAIVWSLSSPASTTVAVADPTYAIQLIVQNTTKDKINVTVNGVATDFTYVSNVVSISGITLKDGDNSIVVTATNDCSSETITYAVNHESCNTPTINTSMNASTSSTATYTFYAIVDNVENASEIVVTLNGVSVPFVFDPVTKELSATLTLVEGTNVIATNATTCDKADNSISVLYEVPCEAVSYTLVSPASTTALFTDSVATFTVSTTNVESKDDITVLLNGAPVAFTFVSNIIKAENLPLVYGMNEIYISFKNDCSTEDINYHVESFPCSAPSIALTSTPSVTDNPYGFIATILNVEKKEDITVSLNGTSVPFDWNASTNQATTNMTLIEGDNAVKVEAVGCQTSAATYTINYDTPCDEITHTLLAPTALSAAVDEETYLLKVKLTGVLKSQITVRQNGADVPFSFFAGTVSATLKLAAGSNMVVVTGDNGCSTEAVEYRIDYAPPFIPCDPITYNYILPNGKSASVAAATYYFKVKFSNATASDFKMVTLNGSPMTYTFSEASGMFERKDMPLVYGENIIVVGYENDCSHESLTFTVTNTLKGSSGGITSEKIPIITNVAPSRTSLSVTSSTYTFKAKLTNVSSKSNVKLTVNGKTSSTFSYSSSSGNVTAVLRLREGVNKIDLVAVNGSKTANRSYNITYTKKSVGDSNTGGGPSAKELTPVITLVSPIRTSSTVASPTFSYRAKVTNVQSRSNLTLKLNGVSVSSFTYSSSSKQISAVFKLRTGVNTIQLVAKNGTKVITKSCSVTYKPKTNTIKIGDGKTGGSTGKPNTGKPSGGKPSGGKPTTGKKTTGGKTTGGKTTTGKPSTGKPSTGSKTTGGKTTGTTGKPSTGKPSGGKPSTGKPATGKSTSTGEKKTSGGGTSRSTGGN